MCPRPGRTCALFRSANSKKGNRPSESPNLQYQRRSHSHRATPGAAPHPHISHDAHPSTRLAPTDCGPFEPRPEVWPVGSFNSIPQKKYGKPINVYVLAYRARLPYPSWAQLVRATLCWNAKTKYHPFMSMFVACTDRYTVTRREKRGKKNKEKEGEG